jgi:hypothetical protein
MGATENKYFDDGYAELVQLEDGVPTRYCSLARRSRQDEAALGKRIEALTGFVVRFGEWEQLEPVGRDFESASEVALFVVETGSKS